MNQHEEEEGPMHMQRIPDDVLADVLQRLDPRGLATSRCVCRAWCALIDDRRLLRSDLLPHSLAGLFINYHELPLSDLFCRPSKDLKVFCKPTTAVREHCNGILRLFNGLFNPATGWWLPLPKLPPPRLGMHHYFMEDMHLVFDPAVSPQCCQVLLIPRVPDTWLRPDYNPDDALPLLETEWPPSPFIINVFSTVTGRWTETLLHREGEAIGTFAEMQLDERLLLRHRPAVYWRGAVYLRCEKDFVMRISLSDHTYRVIEPPCAIDKLCGWAPIHLERSEKGVYFAFVDVEGQLCVWILDDSCSPMKWVLKHNNHVGFAQPVSPNYYAQHVNGPWVLQNTNLHKGDNFEVRAEHDSEWKSDDEDVVNSEETGEILHCQHYGILGFHPYKEIIFLHKSVHRGFAYHLNSSKLETLGDICPKDYTRRVFEPYVQGCFPYTPCMMGELLGSSS